MGNNFAKYIININSNRRNKLALVGNNKSLTYGELEKNIYGYSQILKNLGIQPEDKVIINMDDCPEWVVAYLSIIMIGAVPVPVSPFFSKEQVNNLYEYSNSKLIITEIPEKFLQFNYDFYDWGSDEICYWILTSGTSGKSLGVIHRHNNLKKIVDLFSNYGFYFNEKSRILPSVKLNFGFGMNTTIVGLANGSTIYFMTGLPSPSKIFELFKKNDITHFLTVPAIIRSMIKHQKKCEKFTPEIVVVTGESTPDLLSKEFKNRFNTILLDSYGSSECGITITTQTIDNYNDATCGKPPKDVVCSIRDDNGNEVFDGIVGEMWVKHPCSGFGYWKDWENTKKMFVGEWTRTGDLMLKLPNGNYKYISRNNDIIKINGMFVSPTEIESIILTIDNVIDVAVISKENIHGLQEIHAFVITDKNINLRDLLKGKIEKNKMPKYFHIVKDLPRSVNLKKKRSVLRENLVVF